MRQVKTAKQYKKTGTRALASHIRFEAGEAGKYKSIDKLNRKAGAKIADDVIAKTSRLELSEKLRAKAKKDKKAKRLRTVKQVLTGRAEQKS